MAEERREGPFEQLGETLGGAMGKMAGRANDAMMNVAGSLFGSALQTLDAWWRSSDAEQALRGFAEPQDRACREHFERSRPAAGASAGAGAAPGTYEEARPAYQFGHMASRNPAYQGRPFDEVEAEIERAWEAAGRERYGEWAGVRERVSYGYTHRTPGAPNPS